MWTNIRLGTPLAQHLLESVGKLGLRVDTNVGGHGGGGPFAELVTAVDHDAQAGSELSGRA